MIRPLVPWHKLQRVTSSGSYVPEVDGLRFLAVMAVTTFHVALETQNRTHMYGAPTNPVLHFLHTMLYSGAKGVPLFFFISGFILGAPFANQYLEGGRKVGLKSYFLRRVTRIEPPYVVANLFAFVHRVLVMRIGLMTALSHMLIGLIYLHWLVYVEKPLIVGVGWSLEVEAQFYILAPLIALLIFQRNAILRRSMLGLLLAFLPLIPLFLWYRTPINHFYLKGTLLLNAVYFVAGFLFVDLSLNLLPKLKKSRVWDPIAVCALIAVFGFNSHAYDLYCLPIWFMIIAIAAFKGVWFNRLMTVRPVTTIGGMCYSIYLSHPIMIQIVYWAYMRVFHIRAFGPQLIAAEFLILPCLLCVGAVFFVCVERPCMDKRWPLKLAAYAKQRPQDAQEVSIAG